jgi:3-deoxy-7-phosphoheptulonate synthase
MNNVKNTDDVHVRELKTLIPPAVLIEEFPVSDHASELISRTRSEIEEILSGKDDRLIVVVGPCSIHDPDAALEYADRLLKLKEQHTDALLIVMRVYFEKPRTTVGWKGLINDPNIDDSFDINHGLRIARNLLQQLADKGIPAGCEFLDTISPQFVADFVSWGAIGARTTESQVHRELASGLSMPVGFKNGTAGSISIAVDAIVSASQPHHFLSVTKQGISAIVSTEGNPFCHLILRGSKSGTNYDAASVQAASERLKAQGQHTRVMIDCSHGNSSKDFRKQPEVASTVAQQIAAGSQSIAGVMLESNLLEGNQKNPVEYGVSITDACISWETTEIVIAELAAAVRASRQG